MQKYFITPIKKRSFLSVFLRTKPQYAVIKLTCCFLVFISANSVANTVANTVISATEQVKKVEVPRLWQLVDYYDVNHPVIGRKGMVVSQKRIASEVGADILRRGGNDPSHQFSSVPRRLALPE